MGFGPQVQSRLWPNASYSLSSGLYPRCCQYFRVQMQTHLQNGSPPTGLGSMLEKEQRRKEKSAFLYSFYLFMAPVTGGEVDAFMHILCPRVVVSYIPLSFLLTCNGSLSLLPLQNFYVWLSLRWGVSEGRKQAILSTNDLFNKHV